MSLFEWLCDVQEVTHTRSLLWLKMLEIKPRKQKHLWDNAWQILIQAQIKCTMGQKGDRWVPALWSALETIPLRTMMGKMHSWLARWRHTGNRRQPRFSWSCLHFDLSVFLPEFLRICRDCLSQGAGVKKQQGSKLLFGWWVGPTLCKLLDGMVSCVELSFVELCNTLQHPSGRTAVWQSKSYLLMS